MANKWGENGNSDILFSWAPKLLQMVTAVMKFKNSSSFAANCALFPTGAQCAMSANSSLLGCVCDLLPVQVALRDLGDNSS